MTYPTTTTTLFRSSMPRSKNLVIVNKGPDAALLCREGGNWDLMEIYFSPADIEKITRDPSLTDAEHIVFETERKKRKCAIIKTIFEATDFWHYEAIMMADDDLIPVGCTIAEMFDLFATTGCRIGQPALTHDSFLAHPITIKNNAYIWRRTNFVEVMCPIMTNEAIREYIAIFDATSGFGLDNCWSYHECRKGIGTAILDRTPMR